MILTNRLFTRRAATREAKSIYIFCEGVKREFQYFQYFKEIDSRINVEIYPLRDHEDNSPVGLYNIACTCLIKTEENPNPKYEFIQDSDEVWFVIDTDKWMGKIKELLECSKRYKNWFVAQSNPCFEVWLYNHFDASPSGYSEKCKDWKALLHEKTNSGFDSKRHPIYIKTAIDNSEKTYCEIDEEPSIGCSAVFRLSKVIYQLAELKIVEVILQIDNPPLVVVCNEDAPSCP